MIPPNFAPLLAKEVNFSMLDYGNVWVSPKLDGIRAIVFGGVVYSRKLIPIPNRHVQHLFGRPEFENFDGELICGSPTSKTVYNDTYSAAMSQDGTPNVDLYVFDFVAPESCSMPYQDRYTILKNKSALQSKNVALVPQLPITSEADLLALEAGFLEQGYEGVMLRAWHGPNSKYKYGRSTPKQGTLLKLKRFSDKEAEIIGYEEEMKNNNEATVDELGHTKRSSHQENKVGKGRLGAWVCKTPEGVTFKIGTGYTAKQREDLWRDRDKIVGNQLAKYKSFDIGVVDAPRFPVFLGLRSRIDT